MRILFINYEYPPLGGGGGIETRDLCEELAKKHEVSVLTTGYRGLKTSEVINNVNIYRVPVFGRNSLPTATLRSLVSFFPVAFVYGLYLIPKIKPQVINAHFVVPSGLPAVLLANIFRIPFVLTLIGGDIFDPSKGISPHKHSFLRYIIKKIMLFSDKITAISHDTKERAIRFYSAPEDIEVVPLGFVAPAGEKIEEKSDENKNFSFVSIGRLVPRKGYFDLLRAFSKTANTQSELHIIGDGPLFEELKKESDKLRISARVFLHGRVSEEEKHKILNSSDVYVSASHHEGFGICFLEAMYAGLPIVSTNIGGQTDFLVPGKNALLVPVGDIDKIAKAMDKFSSNKELRQDIGSYNSKDIENYLIGSIAKRYEFIFQDLV